MRIQRGDSGIEEKISILHLNLSTRGVKIHARTECGNAAEQGVTRSVYKRR